MTDPYEILGLASNASEGEIRRRYLDLVRQFSPDRAPERFAEIHQAYEKLRDPVVRMESKLFTLESGDTIGRIMGEVRDRLRKARIPTATLLSLAEDR
jgi:curved DNA-binding protein CbpA